MKIAMLLDGYYPKDIRVRKQAESLVTNGHQVVVICPKYAGESSPETVKGVDIIRIGSNYSKAKKGVNDIVTSILGVHPLFNKHLSRLIKNHNITHLHVHDLPLAQTALKNKDNLPGKIVLDLHENYPEALSVWFKWRKSKLKRLKNKIFFNYKPWKKYEKRMCSDVDHIVAVVDEMKEHLISDHDISNDKITVVSNTEKSSLKLAINDKFEIDSRLKNKKLITYVGGFGAHRGLDVAIKAMKHIVKKEPDAMMVLVGSGNKDVREVLNQMIISDQMEQHIFNLGQHSFADAMSYINRSEINMIPHHANSHTNNTIPHKLFQIITLGKPLLVSSCTPLQRIVKDCEVGEIFEAGDELSFAEHALKILSDYPTYASNAKSGLVNLKKHGYVWEEDARILNEMYLNLEAQREQGR